MAMSAALGLAPMSIGRWSAPSITPTDPGSTCRPGFAASTSITASRAPAWICTCTVRSSRQPSGFDWGTAHAGERGDDRWPRERELNRDPDGNRRDRLRLRVRRSPARYASALGAPGGAFERGDKGCRKGGDRADRDDDSAGPQPAGLLGEERLRHAQQRTRTYVRR